LVKSASTSSCTEKIDNNNKDARLQFVTNTIHD